MQIFIRALEPESFTPALYLIKQFGLVTKYIPASWIVDVNDDLSYLGLAPEPWTKVGFWSRYFDQESEAIAVFVREAEKIIDEEKYA